MKKTIYLHTGFPKTGTTSIQEFLSINKNELEKHSILYPEIDTSHLQPNGKHILVQKPHACKNTNEMLENWNKIKKIINNSNDEKIIISEEGFTLFQDFNNWDMLKIKEEFNVKVICYYRRSVDEICSQYAQNSKSYIFKNKIPFEKFIKEHKIIKDGIPNIYKFSNMFGKDNIIIRPYDKEQWKDGSIISDFMNILDVDNIESFKISTPANPSLSREEADIARKVNILRLNKYMFKMVFFKKGTPMIESLTDKQIKDTIDEYYNDECKLAKDFLNKETMFTQKYPSIYKTKRPLYKDCSLKAILTNHKLPVYIIKILILDLLISLKVKIGDNYYFKVLN